MGAALAVAAGLPAAAPCASSRVWDSCSSRCTFASCASTTADTTLSTPTHTPPAPNPRPSCRRPEFAACGLPYLGGLNDNKLPVPDVPGIDSAPTGGDEAAASPSPPAAEPPSVAPVAAPQLPAVCNQALLVLGLVNSSQSLQVRARLRQQCQRAGCLGRAVCCRCVTAAFKYLTELPPAFRPQTPDAGGSVRHHLPWGPYFPGRPAHRCDCPVAGRPSCVRVHPGLPAVAPQAGL